MNRLANCPSEQELVELVRDSLEDDRAAVCQEHLALCRNCREAVDWIRQHPPRDEPQESELATRLASELDAAREAPHSSADVEASSRRSVSEDLCDVSYNRRELGFSDKAYSDPDFDDLSFDPDSSIIPTRVPSGMERRAEPHADEFGGGRRLGKYELLSRIGAGAFGTVYNAYDEQLRRMVALKILKRSVAENSTARRRFIREARAAAAINHPNVVTIYAVEEIGGLPLLVMEFVSGRTLRERIKLTPRLKPVEILRIAAQIASGLAAAHAQGVVHRDVKPSNVLLENGVERVKLSDFGLAMCAVDNVELTSNNLAVGTPAYMSPEQARGETVDSRADLFGLGCVIYAMVTGDSPFLARTSLETGRRVVEWDPPRLDAVNNRVPAFLAELVERLLRKEPAERYASAEQVASELQDHLARLNSTTQVDAGPSVATSPPAFDAAMEPTPRRQRAVLGATAVLLLLAAIPALFLASPLGRRSLDPHAAQASDDSNESDRKPTDNRSDASPPPEPGGRPASSIATRPQYPSTDPAAFEFDIAVWRKGDAKRQGRSIRERGILPIRSLDGIRIEARFPVSTSVWLIWVDARGEAFPVYPWQPGNWDTYPEHAQPVQSLSLPEQVDTAWPNSGVAGMETLVLLAGPLTAPEPIDFRQLFDGLPRFTDDDQRQFFEFDELGNVRSEVDRAPKFDQGRPLDDPVQKTKEFVRQQLAPHFRQVRLLRFANAGDSPGE
ncbi:MAG: serine/threonine protein kinase [Planctomycetes bacterium]|nr:serine/threonine protein kinase [Planctomycetota bacterium]